MKGHTMAHRYHEGGKHKSARHAMHKAHHEYHMRDREQYAGKEETKMMMARDGHMIHDDWSAPALLPQHVISRDWPRAANYNMGSINDLFTGVEHQMHEDHGELGRFSKPKKY